jgi:N-acetylneuraminate synthase
MNKIKKFSKVFKVGKRLVGEGAPALIIADIGANFDGDLEKAKKLALAVKQSGGDVVKIQSFKANKIVSGRGFAGMKLKGIHGSWNKPIDEVFKSAEFPRLWHKEFFDYCKKIGIEVSSSPYDFEAVDLMEEIGVNFYKIGSGDITWHEMLRYIANKGKPVILATGASTMAEVSEAVEVIRETGNMDFALLQCITNYPSRIESANLKVMPIYKKVFDVITGYSDHTPGDTVVLGAVALGAKVIEKHFTLNKKDVGPDHPHSMEPDEFALMVKHIRDMERALGDGVKKVEEEESETVIVQRRGLCVSKKVKAGETFKKDNVIELRPALGILPKYKEVVVGHKAKKDMEAGSPIKWEDLA